MSPPSLTNEDFTCPFRFLDAKLKEFTAQRLSARDALKSYGWTLRPNHPLTGVWRARRWTKKNGALRLTAPTLDDLIRLAAADAEARHPVRKLLPEGAP